MTQAQWRRVTGSLHFYYIKSDTEPARYVSWNDAQAFINKLNELNDGYEYYLPTEAGWEYACRAGGRQRVAERQ